MKTTTEQPSKEIGFSDKLKRTVALVESLKNLVIHTAQEYHVAEEKLDAIRTLEKELDKEYKEHEVIIEAKRLQAIKVDIATMLETARKNLKNGSMLAFEQAAERKRQAEEDRLAREAKAKADAEAAEAAEAKRKEALKAEAEARRLAKKGDEEAAQAARDRAEQSRLEQERIKQDAASAPAPVVVVPKTAPSVARRMVPKFRIIDGNKIPAIYLIPDLVKIGSVIRSLRGAANIPGVQYYEEAA